MVAQFVVVRADLVIMFGLGVADVAFVTDSFMRLRRCDMFEAVEVEAF